MMVCAAWACNLSGRPIASQKQNAAVIACHQSSWNAKKRETQLICYASFLPQPFQVKTKMTLMAKFRLPFKLFFVAVKCPQGGHIPKALLLTKLNSLKCWQVFHKLEPSGDVVKKHYLRLKFPLVFLRRIYLNFETFYLVSYEGPWKNIYAFRD